MGKIDITQTISWALQVLVSLILLQSLFFKFTGAEESIYIFTIAGQFLGIPGLMEPYGRIATGIGELSAAIMLLIPNTKVLGASLTLVIIGGAIFFHLFSPLGIAILGDQGFLFFLALLAFISSLFILAIRYRTQ